MLPKKVLIVGLLKADSGKTTFSRGLICALKERNINIIPFKPVSGHNFYFQFDTLQENVRNQCLFSHDIDTLIASAQTQLPVELLNPVDRLLVPLDFEKYIQFPRQYFTHIEKVDTLLLQRMSFLRDRNRLQLDNVYLINKPATDKVLWTPQLIEEILKGADQVIEMEDLYQLVTYHAKYFEEITTTAFNAVGERAELILIESLNDVACPARCATSADIIIAVVPGWALFYSPKDFFRTLNLQQQLKGEQRPILMEDLCPVIDPVWKIRLNFRTQREKIGPEFEHIAEYIVSR
ncbi:MAG: hypothetical protein ACE5R6_07800 [Candidatus Heimdallarchaeota archaeon]